MKWYIVCTSPSYEFKVRERILAKIEQTGKQHLFGEVLVPSEEVIELRNGRKVKSTRKFYPGYVFIQMEINDESWHTVDKTSNVTGFVGGLKPTPMKDKEIEEILARVLKAKEKPAPKVIYKKGDAVLVKDGPFKDFNATVDSHDAEKGHMRISVNVFGRDVLAEINPKDVERC